MEATLLQPQVAQAGDLRAYQDGYFRVLVAPEQTDNAFSLVEMHLAPGAEPPRHVHTREDETFYVLEGEVRFQVGGNVLIAKAGQSAFGPRNVPHQFNILSLTARMLVLLTPGQFLDFFMDQSRPLAAAVPVSSPQGPPPPEVLAQVINSLREEHGVLFMP